MTDKNQADKSSSAEKRALWEIRRRYRITPPTEKRSHHSSKPSHRAAAVSAASPRRRVSAPRRGKGRWIKRITLLITIVIILTAGIFGYKILAAGNKISVAERSLLGQLKDLLFSSGQTLKGESENRINFLIIAIGGEGHKGENLADTIIVASVRPADNQVALLSIPRDLYVQVPGEEYFTKINAVHGYGESKGKNQGPEILRQKVEEITGLPIHYYGRIDFIAFKQLVDAVGGIDVTIPNSFYDFWHKISFPAGTERMNGERALAYVRARFIEGSEGGDFKRAARQQHVLLALRDKAFSVQTALDFSALSSIFNSLSDNIRTDMHLWEMRRFYELARSINPTQVRSVVLTTGPNGVLTGATEVLGGAPASVLQPRTGDYSEIQTITKNIFSNETSSPLVDTSSSPAPPSSDSPEPTPSEEIAPKPKIEIRNGTNIAGLAQRTKDKLEKDGYEVIAIGNAKNRATDTTTIFAINLSHADATSAIAESLQARSDSGLPGDESETKADILIILGKDAGPTPAP